MSFREHYPTAKDAILQDVKRKYGVLIRFYLAQIIKHHIGCECGPCREAYAYLNALGII